MSDYKDEFYDEISAAYDERKTEFTDIRTNTHEKFEISKIQFVSSEDILNSQAMGEYFSSVTTRVGGILGFSQNRVSPYRDPGRDESLTIPL